MKLIKFSVLFAFGGALRLLIVPLLPDATQSQVASLQDEAYKLIRKAEIRAEFRSTMDEAIVKWATLETLVQKLINNERVNYGMEPLNIDRDLSEVARGHSQDMSIMNFFAHENLLGQAPTDRADAKGYQCRKDYGSYYTARTTLKESLKMFSKTGYFHSNNRKGRRDQGDIACKGSLKSYTSA